MELPEDLLNALIDTGNRALNDYYHERACSCSEWPDRCSTPVLHYGYWDTDAFAIALPSLVARLDELRARNSDTEKADLQSRLELERQITETFVNECDRLRTRLAAAEEQLHTLRNKEN